MTDRFLSRAVAGLRVTPRASARHSGGGDADISQLLERYAAVTAIPPAPDLASRILRAVAARPKTSPGRRYLAAIAGGSPRMAMAAFRDVMRVAVGGGRTSRLVRGQALALVLLTVMAASALAAAGAVGVGLVLRQIDLVHPVLMPVVPLPESSASPSSDASWLDPDATRPASNTATVGSSPGLTAAPPASTDLASPDLGRGPGSTPSSTPSGGPSRGPDATSAPAPTSESTPGPTPPPTARPSDPPEPTPTPERHPTPRPTDALATPEPTNTPHPIDTPRPTGTAHPTHHPEQTDGPKPSEGPDTTEVPGTQEPDDSDPPDDGDGGGGGGGGGGGDDGGGDSGGAPWFLSVWWWLG